MREVILAGGAGTRLAEQTDLRPKPLVEIDRDPIPRHIQKYFVHYGHREFFFALGYRGDDIKRYFMDRASLNGDMTIQLGGGKLKRYAGKIDSWTIHLANTGIATNAGGRAQTCQCVTIRNCQVLCFHGLGANSNSGMLRVENGRAVKSDPFGKLRAGW